MRAARPKPWPGSLTTVAESALPSGAHGDLHAHDRLVDLVGVGLRREGAVPRRAADEADRARRGPAPGAAAAGAATPSRGRRARPRCEALRDRDAGRPCPRRTACRRARCPRRSRCVGQLDRLVGLGLGREHLGGLRGRGGHVLVRVVSMGLAWRLRARAPARAAGARAAGARASARPWASRPRRRTGARGSRGAARGSRRRRAWRSRSRPLAIAKASNADVQGDREGEADGDEAPSARRGRG